MIQSLHTMSVEQLDDYRNTCMNLCYQYTCLANVYADQHNRCVVRLRELGADPDKPRATQKRK